MDRMRDLQRAAELRGFSYDQSTRPALLLREQILDAWNCAAQMERDDLTTEDLYGLRQALYRAWCEYHDLLARVG